MITIAIDFPAGRYHATPWGSHVNEGLVEWPPNPWRLMRALIATGFAKLHWDEVPEDAKTLMSQLASVLPEYHLPKGQLAHTRHYMPSGGFHNKQKNLETTDKVLDTFVRLRPDQPLFVRWPTELGVAEIVTLSRLLRNVSYLGRAESWIDMRIVDTSIPENNWTRPSNGEGPPVDGDQITLLTTMTPEAYGSWRGSALATALEIEQKKPGRKLSNAAVEAKFPADLAGCLTMDTSVQQKYGWSQPPGSNRVLYDRINTLEPLPQRRSSHRRTPTVDCALLALSSDSVRGDRLPRMSRAVRQSEFIHQALVSIVNKKLNVRNCSVLTGRNEAGEKLSSPHTHAHYFPLDLDHDRRIDHVLVYASAGLDEIAQRAITYVRRTWTKGDDTTIFVTCAGFGGLDLFRRQIRHRDGCPATIIPPQPATSWESITPYVPARHLKLKNNRYTVTDDVVRELELRGMPEPNAIELFEKYELIQNKFHNYVRRRIERKPQPPRPDVYGIRIRFNKPHPGPIALGYGSHFGLGMFGAVAELGDIGHR
ncbi:MAG: type I-U CRISPR-associated protein Csb2 [Candidatus Paceibacterota bacterium]